MYYIISNIDTPVLEQDPDIIAFKSVIGALMLNKTYTPDQTLFVYKLQDDYPGAIQDSGTFAWSDGRDTVSPLVTGAVTLLYPAKFYKYCEIKISSLADIYELRTPFDTNPNGDLWRYNIWNYSIIGGEAKDIIESVTTDVDVVMNIFEMSRNEIIAESVSGALLLIIPKLIKLIIVIVSKISYLLAIPLVKALVNDTKNIRRTGEAVLTGSTSVREVASSINYADVRSAISSVSKGDVAEFVTNMDKSLATVKTEEKDRLRKEMADDGRIYDNIADHNKHLITNINDKMKKDLKVLKFIDESQLNVLYNSLDMMKDENLIHTEMYYIKGLDNVKLSEFESKNHRYDLKFLEGYIEKVRVLVEFLERNNSPELVDEVRVDTSHDRKIFTSYYIDCVAKLNPHREYFPKELFNNHFTLREGKVINEMKPFGTIGDFEHLQKEGFVKKKTVLDILKENNDDLDDLNAVTIRSFGFYAGHINNKNNTEEINRRRDSIDMQLKDMQKAIERITPDSIGYGLEHSYISALLEFLRVDLINIMNTIKKSKMYFMDNHENMMDVIDILSEEIIGTYMYIILDDIIKNPNIYKATDTAMKTIIAMYKDRGGVVR